MLLNLDRIASTPMTDSLKRGTYILLPHVVSCPVCHLVCVCFPADIGPVQPIISSAGADRLLAHVG